MNLLGSYDHDKVAFQFKDIDNKLKDKTINSSDSVLKKFIKNIKFPGSNICPCRPGEKAAVTLLENFINENKIYSYNSARDFPSHNGTSFLSASLRFLSLIHISEPTRPY